MSVSASEAEVHWRAFLGGLVKRGLHGVRLIVSDDHAGPEGGEAFRLPRRPVAKVLLPPVPGCAGLRQEARGEGGNRERHAEDILETGGAGVAARGG